MLTEPAPAAKKVLWMIVGFIYLILGAFWLVKKPCFINILLLLRMLLLLACKWQTAFNPFSSPDDRAPLGQHQEPRPLAGPDYLSMRRNIRSLRLTDFPSKSGKSDWLRIWNKYSARDLKIWSGQRSWCLVLTKMSAPSGGREWFQPHSDWLTLSMRS